MSLPSLVITLQDNTVVYRDARHLESEGHPFHGNQWTDRPGPSTLLSEPGLPDSLRMKFNGPEELQLAQNIGALRATAERLDFPPEKIKIEAYDRSFNVAGQNFSEGGHFSPGEGTITLNANTLARTSPNDARTMLAHEITHRDWNDVEDALGLTGGEGSLNPDDLPKSAAKILDIMSEYGYKLEEADGVTEYSKAYWKAVPKEPKYVPYSDNEIKNGFMNPNTGEVFEKKPFNAWPPTDYDQKFRTAVNETLAEVSKIDIQRSQGVYPDGVKTFDPSPVWRELHTAVKDTAKAVRNTEVMTHGGFEKVVK